MISRDSTAGSNGSGDGLDLNDVILRLIEMGHGQEAVPTIERGVAELLGSNSSEEGFELEDLLGFLRARGNDRVAGWIEEAVADLVEKGGPVTSGRRSARKEKVEDDAVFVRGRIQPALRIPRFRYRGERTSDMVICSIACGRDHMDMMYSMAPTVSFYAAKHGMDSVMLRDFRFDESRPPAWDKVIMIRSLLEVYETVLWIDSDAIICDPEIDIRTVAPRSVPMHIVAHEYDEKVVPNTGVWLIHRSESAFDLLEEIWACTEFVEHAWWENAALMELIGYDPRGYSCTFDGPTPFTPLVSFLDRQWNSIGLDSADDPIILHYAGEPVADRKAKLTEQSELFFTKLVSTAPEKRKAESEGDGETAFELDLTRIPNRRQIPSILNFMGLTGRAVEVGVKEGEFSEHILSYWKGTELVSVDPWREFAPDAYIDVANVEQLQHEEFYQTTVDRLSRFGERSTIMRTTSAEAAEHFDDRSLDFVYLDARHDYTSVLEDLDSWFPKVRLGGIIAGHDYLNGMLPEGDFGVQSAVDEYFRRLGLQVRSTVRDQPWVSWLVHVEPTIAALESDHETINGALADV